MEENQVPPSGSKLGNPSDSEKFKRKWKVTTLNKVDNENKIIFMSDNVLFVLLFKLKVVMLRPISTGKVQSYKLLCGNNLVVVIIII